MPHSARAAGAASVTPRGPRRSWDPTSDMASAVPPASTPRDMLRRRRQQQQQQLRFLRIPCLPPSTSSGEAAAELEAAGDGPRTFVTQFERGGAAHGPPHHRPASAAAMSSQRQFEPLCHDSTASGGGRQGRRMVTDAQRDAQMATMSREDTVAAEVLRSRLQLEQEKLYQGGAEAAMRRVGRGAVRTELLEEIVAESSRGGGGGSVTSSVTSSSRRGVREVDDDLMWASIRKQALSERIFNLRQRITEEGIGQSHHT
mgnify:CR=1 FL=1